MELTEMIHKIKSIIIELSGLNINPDDISDGEMIFGAEGALDSIKALQLLAQLETDFGIAIPDEELNVEIFESISKLASIVLEKLERKDAG
ncbi:MAG: acyl carrier protein [Bacillota bacterium]